jgi:hypothetical protein
VLRGIGTHFSARQNSQVLFCPQVVPLHRVYRDMNRQIHQIDQYMLSFSRHIFGQYWRHNEDILESGRLIGERPTYWRVAKHTEERYLTFLSLILQYNLNRAAVSLKYNSLLELLNKNNT